MITKAIIPIAGLGTRFLPLSKVLPKEFFPLADKPLLQYIIEEAKAAGVTDFIFVVNSNKKIVQDYLKRSLKLEKILEERKQDKLLEELRSAEKVLQDISASFVTVPAPLGDGHAVLQARKLVGEDPCFIFFPDDIMECQVPASVQLAKVYNTAQKPIVGLCKVPQEKTVQYGIIDGEKLASRLYKVKKSIEKPATPELAPSNLAMVGRRIITPDVFDYIKKTKPNKKGEIILAEVIEEMVKDGKMVYGYEIEGKWWECGNKASWMKSFVHFALNNDKFGKEMKSFIKEEKI